MYVFSLVTRWHKKEYQNLTDRNSSGQNTTEAHISGSTPTTAISSVTDPRPGPALVIST